MTPFAATDPIYPNPILTTATVPYRLNQPGYVRLTVYNLRGQEVLLLVDSVVMPAGRATQWNGIHGMPAAVGSPQGPILSC
ncbi:MAG: T9SS type A sorting domain-containing protein [Candidatus Marinimicrobia bacterium]|nr:T9SS type A sorting domain-containing protein [Candidatus Neomarinimicrobiota bacterium]